MTEFPDTRASLLVRVQSPDDHRAWETFVATYRPVIYRMARRRGLQDSDAQDATQDILLRVAKAIDRYEPQAGVRFRNWLSRVARNAILSSLTRSPPDAGQGGTDAVDWLDDQPQAAATAIAELDWEVLRERFLRAAAVVRNDVNGETWAAFELTVIQEVSCEEAARTLGKSLGTVYAARSRVLKRLRDHIGTMAGDLE